MTILFDHGTPVPLRKHLPGRIETAYERGWSTLKNGDLLREAESNGFTVLITTDQNLKYQQKVLGRTIAIIVLRSTSWPRIKERVPVIQEALLAISSGEYHEIEI